MTLETRGAMAYIAPRPSDHQTGYVTGYKVAGVIRQPSNHAGFRADFWFNV